MQKNILRTKERADMGKRKKQTDTNAKILQTRPCTGKAFAQVKLRQCCKRQVFF